MRQPLALLLATVLAFAALLAGCSNPPSEAGESSTITTVTDPNAGRTDPSMGEHLHDYWGGQDRLLLMDTVLSEENFVSVGTPEAPVAIFRPEAGAVVPQGAARVEVTVSWTNDQPTNRFEDVQLWVKSAADREAQSLGSIEQRQTVVVESTNERNDLPHQLLSAWEFHWVLSAAQTGPFPGIWYSGRITLVAEAVRGLGIPLYPGHPDRWNNATEMLLFDAQGTATADGNMESGDYRCYGACPPLLVPDDGVVIPIDADHVSVTLDRAQPLPTRMGLKYHDAASRDWVVAKPDTSTSTSRTYVLPVGNGGDGPYAKQSQWEFMFYVEEPVADGAIVEQWSTAATVYRQP